MNYNIFVIYFLYYKLIPQVHVISKFADNTYWYNDNSEEISYDNDNDKK